MNNHVMPPTEPTYHRLVHGREVIRKIISYHSLPRVRDFHFYIMPIRGGGMEIIMKRLFMGFAAGVTFVVVLGLFYSILGEGNLENIAVSFDTVKRIVVDKEEKAMPEDVRPFVYNDRTYVPLRFLAETVGKPVDWDETTGTVYIGEKKSARVVVEDDFTEWFWDVWDIHNKYGDWGVENGVAVSRHHGYNQRTCILPLIDEDLAYKDLTVEVDFMVPSDLIIKTQWLGFFFGGKFATPDKSVRNWVSVKFDESYNITTPTPHEDGESIMAPYDRYFRLRVIKTGDILDVYVDGVFMYSQQMDNNFETGKIGLAGNGTLGIRYYDNFKLTVVE